MERKQEMQTHSAGAAMMAAGVLDAADEERELKKLGKVYRNNGQAMPRGARIAAGAEQKDRGAAKRATRKAVADLVDATGRTIVLSHVHPRWLRGYVEMAMEMGQRVTEADISRWRAEGLSDEEAFG